MREKSIFALCFVATILSAIFVSCQKEEVVPEPELKPQPGVYSPRLLVNDLVDNENAVRVLRAEAAVSGGLLSIDTAPHLILVE
jgi:hypothetical protein